MASCRASGPGSAAIPASSRRGASACMKAASCKAWDSASSADHWAVPYGKSPLPAGVGGPPAGRRSGRDRRATIWKTGGSPWRAPSGPLHLYEFAVLDLELVDGRIVFHLERAHLHLTALAAVIGAGG